MSPSNRNWPKPGGLSVRVLHAILILCALAAVGLMIAFSAQSAGVFTSLSSEMGNYITRQKAAHDLMEASDYLTEMAQRFTLDGERAYLDQYFQEAEVSRRREAAILAMSENNADEALIRQLQEAMEESQALMYREYYAMRLVLDAMGEAEMPDTLRAVELTEEDAFRTAEEKMNLARNLVMGSEYYASKAIIRGKLRTNLEILEDQMTRTRQESTARMTRQLESGRILIALAGAALLAGVFLIIRMGTRPLEAGARALRKGQPIPAAGVREFREIAERYNETVAFRPSGTETAGEES